MPGIPARGLNNFSYEGTDDGGRIETIKLRLISLSHSLAKESNCTSINEFILVRTFPRVD